MFQASGARHRPLRSGPQLRSRRRRNGLAKFLTSRQNFSPIVALFPHASRLNRKRLRKNLAFFLQRRKRGPARLFRYEMGSLLDNEIGQVTQLLKAMRAGDEQAAGRLSPLIYAELHHLAKAHMRPDHSRPTALINEAYLHLVGEDIDWNSRAHFIGLAAHVMRQVLVDYAHALNPERQGDALDPVGSHEELAVSIQQLNEVAELDEALKNLEHEKPRRARVVELRYF